MNEEKQKVPAEGKKKRSKLGLGILIGVILTLWVFGLIGGIAIAALARYQAQLITYAISRPDYIPDNSGKLDTERIGNKLELLQDYISKYYLYEEDLAAAEEGIYHGFISSLDDKYAAYYTPEEFIAMDESSRGSYSGIGAMLVQAKDTRIMTIVKVFNNSPAKEAGLLPGDILYKVDGEDITAMDLDLLVTDRIRGPEGTSFDLTVLRGDTHEEITFHLTRRVVESQTVDYRMLADNTGYIEVTEFDEVTEGQFKKAVDDLRDQGMERLVIDLRDNPGGLVNICLNMADYILPDGLMTYTADKAGRGSKFYSRDGKQLDLPLAILINGNSASASEIFAGAVQDFGAGILVGTQSFGKGIIQNIWPLPDGSALKMTVMHYYTPSGFDLHGEGLTPDILVEADDDMEVGTDTDNQLAAAVEALKKQNR